MGLKWLKQATNIILGSSWGLEFVFFFGNIVQNCVVKLFDNSNKKLYNFWLARFGQSIQDHEVVGEFWRNYQEHILAELFWESQFV